MRTRSFTFAALVALTSVTGLAACGSSDKSSDTTVAAVETTAAAAETTAAAATETTMAAVETTMAATETTMAATETTAAGSAGSATTMASAAGMDAASTDALLTTLLQGFNGGATPAPEDVACVSGKVSKEQLSALMSAGAAGGAPDMKALKPVLQAVFACAPAGMAESMSSSFSDMPSAATAEQKTCFSKELLSIMASDDTLLDTILSSPDGNLSSMPKAERDAVIAKANPAVNKCFPESMRAEVIAAIGK